MSLILRSNKIDFPLQFDCGMVEKFEKLHFNISCFSLVSRTIKTLNLINELPPKNKQKTMKNGFSIKENNLSLHRVFPLSLLSKLFFNILLAFFIGPWLWRKSKIKNIFLVGHSAEYFFYSFEYQNKKTWSEVNKN